MLALRPGLGLKVVQDHFLEALVLVLRYLDFVLNGGPVSYTHLTLPTILRV